MRYDVYNGNRLEFVGLSTNQVANMFGISPEKIREKERLRPAKDCDNVRSIVRSIEHTSLSKKQSIPQELAREWDDWIELFRRYLGKGKKR